MRDKCEHCKFWRDIDQVEGSCMRYAPSPTLDLFSGKTPWARWLHTAHNDWCGDFKLGEAAQELRLLGDHLMSDKEKPLLKEDE